MKKKFIKMQKSSCTYDLFIIYRLHNIFINGGYYG